MAEEAPLTTLFELDLENAPDNELFEEIRDGIAASRGSPGNVVYRMFQAVDRPSVLILYEQWRDHASLEAHRRSPRFLSMRAAIDEVMPGGLRNHTRVTEVDEFENGAWNGPAPGRTGAAG